jgi:hypothetical protein
MIKALLLPAAGALVSLCVIALTYAYFGGAVGRTARCSRNPNTCQNSYCAWPHCDEEMQ